MRKKPSTVLLCASLVCFAASVFSVLLPWDDIRIPMGLCVIGFTGSILSTAAFFWGNPMTEPTREDEAEFRSRRKPIELRWSVGKITFLASVPLFLILLCLNSPLALVFVGTGMIGMMVWQESDLALLDMDTDRSMDIAMENLRRRLGDD